MSDGHDHDSYGDPPDPRKRWVPDRKIPRGPGVCPLCGGETVSRTGKFGAFYGCVNYPKCKGSRNL